MIIDVEKWRLGWRSQFKVTEIVTSGPKFIELRSGRVYFFVADKELGEWIHPEMYRFAEAGKSPRVVIASTILARPEDIRTPLPPLWRSLGSPFYIDFGMDLVKIITDPASGMVHKRQGTWRSLDGVSVHSRDVVTDGPRGICPACAMGVDPCDIHVYTP